MLAQLEPEHLFDAGKDHAALGAANRLPQLRSLAAQFAFDTVQMRDLAEKPAGLDTAFVAVLFELAPRMRPAA